MSLNRTIDALVVGAGPVGLTAALTLARDGRRVEIIEEAQRRTGLSYALALHPAALDALGGLGVTPALTARGNRIDRVAFYEGAVRKADLSLRGLGRAHSYVVVLPQSELEEILLAALKKEDVEVRWNHRLRLLEDGEAGVACTIDRIDADSSGYAISKVGGVVGKTFEREIPLVLGADGHGSMVRRQLGIELRPTGPVGTVAVFELDGAGLPADLLEAEARSEMRVTFTGGLRTVWWPLPGERTRLGFELPADEQRPTAGRDKSRLPSIVPWLASTLDERRLQDLAADRLPWHPAPSGHLMWSVAVRVERALADSFGRGRVWLAGDAAHLAFPFGVRSMNEGIVEARELAARCGRILAGVEPLATLEAYGKERLAHWRTLLEPERAAAGLMGGDPWLTANASGILETLPMAAEDAEQLLTRVVVA